MLHLSDRKCHGRGSPVVARHPTVVLITRRYRSWQIASGKVLPRVLPVTVTRAGSLAGEHAELPGLSRQVRQEAGFFPIAAGHWLAPPNRELPEALSVLGPEESSWRKPVLLRRLGE